MSPMSATWAIVLIGALVGTFGFFMALVSEDGGDTLRGVFLMTAAFGLTSAWLALKALRWLWREMRTIRIVELDDDGNPKR